MMLAFFFVSVGAVPGWRRAPSSLDASHAQVSGLDAQLRAVPAPAALVSTTEVSDVETAEVPDSELAADDECTSGRARRKTACNGGDGLPVMQIAVWSDMWGIGGTPVQGGVVTKQCPLAHDAVVKCEFRDLSAVVDEGGQAPLGWADAVLFNVPTLGALPLQKHPGQVWVSFCSEPALFDDQPGAGQDCSRLADPALAEMDLASNYTEAADIPAVFPVPSDDVLRRTATPLLARNTTLLASLLLSNCHSASRNSVIQALNASLTASGYGIASYGACFQNAVEPTCAELGSGTCARQAHPFSLAFENTRSNRSAGYVTEKVWDALRDGAVPVYWGDADAARKVLPLGSTIYVADFASVEQLAAHLVFLVNNPAAYSEYLAWKRRPLPAALGRMRTNSWDHLGCNVCRAARAHLAGAPPPPPPWVTARAQWGAAGAAFGFAAIIMYVDEATAYWRSDSGGRIRARAAAASRSAGAAGWGLLWLACQLVQHATLRLAGDAALQVLPGVHLVFTAAVALALWPFFVFAREWATALALWAPVVLFCFVSFALQQSLLVPGTPTQAREPRVAIAVATVATPFIASVLEERVFGETRVKPMVLYAALAAGLGALICAGVYHGFESPSPRGGVVLALLTAVTASTQTYQRHVFSVSMPSFGKLNAVLANNVGCALLVAATLPGVWRHPDRTDVVPWLVGHAPLTVATGLLATLQAVAAVEFQARTRASTALVLSSAALAFTSTLDVGFEAISAGGLALAMLGGIGAVSAAAAAHRADKPA